MPTSIHKAITLFREGAYAEIADKILYKCGKVLFSPIFYYDHFYLLEHAAEDQPPVPGPSKVRVRQATPDDTPRLCALSQRSPEVIQGRFGSGRLCFVAERERNIVGMTWIAPEHSSVEVEQISDCWFRVPSKSAWGFDSLVDPGLRRSGVWRSLDDSRLRFLKGKGIPKLIVMTRALNAPSMAAHKRCGYRIVKDIKYFRFLFLRGYFAKDAASENERAPWRTEIRIASRYYIPEVQY